MRKDIFLLLLLYLLYKDESVCVCVWVCVGVCGCVYVCPAAAAGPTQPITLKFGIGSSFDPGSAPIQGATPNVDHRGYPL